MPSLSLMLPATAVGGGFLFWRLGVAAVRMVRRRHLVEIIEVRPEPTDRFAGFLEAMCTAGACTWSAKVEGTWGADAEWRLRALARQHSDNLTIVAFPD